MHTPVLLKEILEVFDPQPGQTYIDATVNGGGHGAAILEKISPRGTLVGIDWDCGLIEAAKIQFSKPNFQNNKIILECANYANLQHITAKHHVGAVDGILFDLGFSSHHVEASGRGFSFLKDEALDMRYSHENTLTAEKIINTWPRDAIENILREYGEERFARRIAGAIDDLRKKKKVRTTAELAILVARAVPRQRVGSRIHPATRTFQALRIAVNHELENVQKALPQTLSLLKPGGRIAVISFHSLEDRIVKRFFQEKAKENNLSIITKRPIIASAEEIRENPRARSAKLRAARKS